MNESRQREAQLENDLQVRNRKLDELNRQLRALEGEAIQRQQTASEQLKEKRQSYANAIRT